MILHSWGQALKDDLPPDNLSLFLQPVVTGWSSELSWSDQTYASWLFSLTVTMNKAAAPQRKKRKGFIPYFLGFVIFLYCAVQLISWTSKAAQHQHRLRRALGESQSSPSVCVCVCGLFRPPPDRRAHRMEMMITVVWRFTTDI